MAIYYYNQPRISEPFVNINADIGNVMFVYYYNLVIAILEQRDFIYEPEHIQYNNVKDIPVKDVPFVKNLAKIVPFNKDIFDRITALGATTEIFKQLYWCDVCWSTNNNITYGIAVILKPTVQKIMEDAFIASDMVKDVDTPVIHFRCADTPFIRNDAYHFQKYRFFKDALDDLESENRSVILMNCSSHLSQNREKDICATYADSITDYLKEEGYTATRVCGDNLDDFATLFYAPAVISTASSFSFMSGFFGKGQFISTSHEPDANTPVCEDCKEFRHGYNLYHNDVPDYYDVEDVKARLRS